jgi:hypothetical protein
MRSRTAGQARLISRVQRVDKPASTGLQQLGLNGKRDGLFYIPTAYRQMLRLQSRACWFSRYPVEIQYQAVARFIQQE